MRQMDKYAHEQHGQHHLLGIQPCQWISRQH